VKLLTGSYAGGAIIDIGEKSNCETPNRVTALSLDHTFMSDKDEDTTILKSDIPITLRLGVAETTLYSCHKTIVFTPLKNISYLMEVSYHAPGCKIEIFKVGKDKKILLENNKIKVCSEKIIAY
jgi:hypothetical protein